MNIYRYLQNKHNILLKSQNSGEDILKEAERYIEISINAGQDITNPTQREQLRANNRFWGNFIYEKTGAFPKTDILPPSPTVLFRQRVITWAIRILGLILVVLFLFNLYLSLSPKPTILPKPVVCTPQAPNVNIYRAALALPALTPNGATPNANGATGVNTNLSEEQVMALLQGTPLPGTPSIGVPGDYISILGTLVTETKAWSDVQTIKLDDTSTAQIVVTFISPQLIQAVYYSELTSRGYAISSPQSALATVAAREELMFFVTVITSTNNKINNTPHTIQIPIQKMALVNSDNLLASPLRNDHILSQPINSSFEPVFGYLSYPIAMINGIDCSWILNPNYNNNITISVSDILVDGISTGPYTWVIPFSSLIKTEGFPTPTPQSNVAIDPNLISTSFVPPGPMVSLLTPNGLPETTFWQIYAGFLWRQVMTGIY